MWKLFLLYIIRISPGVPCTHYHHLLYVISCKKRVSILISFVAWTLSSLPSSVLCSRHQNWTVFQAWPDKCWVNWDNGFIFSDGVGHADAAQHPADFLCCSRTLLSDTKLVHQDPQDSFQRAVPQSGEAVLPCLGKMFSLQNSINMLEVQCGSLNGFWFFGLLHVLK